MGQTIPVSDASRLLPNTPDVPFTFPVNFRDRLGVFLADGERLPSGQFPQPEDGHVTVFQYADIPARENRPKFRVHARPLFHGRPKYSFVEAQAGAEIWYGRVWLLLQCQFRGSTYDLALVSWLQNRASAPFATRKLTFSWASRFVDCIELGHLLRVVTIAPSCIPRTGAQGQVLHLLK